MDKSVCNETIKMLIDAKIEKTIKSLEKNNIASYYCKTSKDAQNLVKTLINKGDTISSGGSVSLVESGIYDIITNGDYNYLDRTRENITREEIEQVYRDTFSADTYFCSSNAVTADGYLYNVDGNSNRVAAILYGPKSVVMIVGYNKIVDNLNEAIKRVKTISAPANTVRLSMNTPCNKTYNCTSLNKSDAYMCDGCSSEDRICCNFTVSGQQRHKNRIKVIIVGENLGY